MSQQKLEGGWAGGRKRGGEGTGEGRRGLVPVVVKEKNSRQPNNSSVKQLICLFTGVLSLPAQGFMWAVLFSRACHCHLPPPSPLCADLGGMCPRCLPWGCAQQQDPLSLVPLPHHGGLDMPTPTPFPSCMPLPLQQALQAGHCFLKLPGLHIGIWIGIGRCGSLLIGHWYRPNVFYQCTPNDKLIQLEEGKHIFFSNILMPNIVPIDLVHLELVNLKLLQVLVEVLHRCTCKQHFCTYI